MRSLKPVEDELTFIGECSLLFDVWQQAALAQLRRLQDAQAARVRLTERLAAMAWPLLPRAAARAPWAAGGQGRVMIVVTSDEGLVGPLHHDVVRAALACASEPSRWIAIGARGGRLLEEAGARPNRWAMPSEPQQTGCAEAVAAHAMEWLKHQPAESVWLVYPELVTMTMQRPVTVQMLPWPAPAASAPEELAIEPSLALVTDELVRVWWTQHLLEAMTAAHLSELAARAMHMESSRDELGQRLRQVKREQFKLMHERVDVMVRELRGVRKWR